MQQLGEAVTDCPATKAGVLCEVASLGAKYESRSVAQDECPREAI